MITIKKGKNRFYVGESEDNSLAEMSFIYRNNVIDINHTAVSDELRGQNVGKQLLQRIVEMARDEKIKIIPSCPFVAAQFNKMSEYQDIMHKE